LRSVRVILPTSGWGWRMGAAQTTNGTQEPAGSFMAQLKSFGAVYWIANWMELVERFAYYGVRTVLPVFMVASFAAGGPELDHRQKGTIYAVWAIVQSFVPILSGGFADRYGYKLNIALSSFFKILGYVVMGFCVPIAEWLAGQPIAEARAAGADSVYGIFFAGAMMLALGTAIFKPGVQGLIAYVMPKGSASLGWGLFYQMVNIGGFVGPLLAGYLRVLDWTWVFLICAAGIALNFIPMLFFAEPDKEARRAKVFAGPMRLLYDAIRGLLEPRLFFFTISFAGFWLMFYQLFDILPNFIDDWVDSRGVAAWLTDLFGEGVVPTVNGGNLTQEWIINVNALLISFLAFAVGYLTGRVRPLSAIVTGIAVSAVGIFMLGLGMDGWTILLAIAVFSFGEMAASPTKMRYLSDLAPEGKVGLYMGYSNFTVGIGWSIGSVVAGDLYQTGGDKIELAKRYLVEHLGMASEAVKAIKKDDVLTTLQAQAKVDAVGARELLWNTYSPQTMWTVFTWIGLASLAAIVAYTLLVKRANQNPTHSFNTRGEAWVRWGLVPIMAAFGYFVVTGLSAWLSAPEGEASFPLGLLLNTAFFGGMTAIAWLDRSPAGGRAA
jgi:POT family proton-dependent oligopeptide transporter